ncbi:Indole-3-acetic acid-amido synthetase GH3.17 [Hibiscus syriacus]|uniref:Indole-3-acetic acid-amido synthetase GH3.17 n=1 Tax=Hibiscus syriacus TaxID=106335 RepID=A0A6A3AC11_HIBSY|nr:Indole-3-acetic acid-amido synthetase GH3.17 [Hibiscus syriacus]
MELMFAKPEVGTPSGLKASAASTRLFKGSSFRDMLPKLYTSPFETIFCPDTKQRMYCQLLFGLIQRDEVVKIGSVFASTVLRSIKFFKNNWKELCSNITGRISDWITDSGCWNASSSIVKPDPELADLVENICRCESWHGIIRRLWPKTKYVAAVCTGAMMQYTAELEFNCGGLPLVGVYYEFVPVKEECVTETRYQAEFRGVSHNDSLEMKSIDEDTEPVDLVNMKPARCFELLVTSSTGLYRYRVEDVLMVTGFHNNAPQFRFMGRQNIALSVDMERTSQADLLKAVIEAKTLLDQLGFILS